jgi:hypothetical protein
MVIPVLGFSQAKNVSRVNPLPDEIGQYYKNLNFVNSISTPSERVQITKYFDTNDVPSEFKTKRLIRTSNTLKEIDLKVIKIEPVMPNAFDVPSPTSPHLYNILEWYKSEETIAVKLKIYQLGTSNNLTLINMYSEGKDTLSEQEVINSYSLSPIRLELHVWILKNNQWFKNKVNKVLLNK